MGDRDFFQDWGTASPELDDPFRTNSVGWLRSNKDSTSPIVEWICTVAGRPGTWVARYGGGFGGASLPRVANIAALAAIDCTAYSTAEAHICEVLSVSDLFLHHPTGGRGTWSAATAYVVGDIVYHANHSYVSIQNGTNQTPAYLTAYWTRSLERVASAVGTSLWTRMLVENKTAQAQTHWAIDASNLSGVADDENLGYGTTDAAARLVPLRSMAEWRRRINGAVFPTQNASTGTQVVINVMSDSTVEDDAILWGFSTSRSSLFPTLVLIAVPIVVFTGTVTSYTPMGGNNRHLITDTAIPTSWTASDGVTTTTGSRWIRKVGANVHAACLVDRGSRTIQIGPSTTAEESVSSIAGSAAPFTVGDNYEVYRIPKWPGIFAAGTQIAVKTVCLDISTPTVPGDTGLRADVIIMSVLCGFLSALGPRGGKSFNTCVFTGASVVAEGLSIFDCSFLNVTTVRWFTIANNLNIQTNMFVNSEVQIWNGARLNSGGLLLFFDNVARTCLSVRRGGHVENVTIAGAGNTGLLLHVDTNSSVRVFSIDATITTLPNSIHVQGIDYPVAAIPIIDVSTGSAVYQ